MAAPTYATDLNDIYLDSGNFSTVGGGRVTDVETDDFIQGSNCWSHDPFSSGIEGGVHDTVSAETITADDAVYIWTKCDVAATLATHAAGGIQALIGNSATALKCYYVRGSDDYAYGGWVCIPVDPTLTPSTNIGSPSGTWDHFGVRWNVPGSGASKGYPMKIDAMRHGRNLEITAGDSGTPATWDATAIYDAATTRQWGICQPTDTGAAIQGLVYWGTAATAVYSRDSNRTIVINDTEFTTTDFTQILFAHASNDVEWDNVGLNALGTSNRGIIDITADGAVTWTNSVFQGIDVTTMLAGSTFDGSKWISCNEVDSGGGSLLGAQILTPTVAVDSYGLLWNAATDPDGSLDEMIFSKGTNSHHAIEFGTSAPTTMTLRGCDFTDFTGTSTAATLNFLRTTGTTTVNLIGCTGTVTAQVTGTHTVAFVVDPVAIAIHVQNITTGADIVGARAYVLAAATGPLPFEDIVTITRVTTTATVAHTAHGLATNQWVKIESANQEDYNGAKQITKIDDDSYSYTVANSPTTGTIVATAVIIFGLTDANGDISDSRSYSSDQDFTGRIRKSSDPYFKNSPLSGTIDSTNGLPLTVGLIPDE